MNPTDWLRILAGSMPGRPTAARTSSLLQYAFRLKASAPHGSLTPQSAEEIGRGLAGFPTFDDLVERLRDYASSEPDNAPAVGNSEARAYVRVFQGRIAAGVPMETLLAIASRHYPSDAWEEIKRIWRADIQRHAPHLDPPPVSEEELRIRLVRLQRIHQAAPPPSGPTGATAEAPPPPPRSSLLTGDALAAARAKTGVRVTQPA